MQSGKEVDDFFTAFSMSHVLWNDRTTFAAFRVFVCIALPVYTLYKPHIYGLSLP